jgi:hypothetical protein
VISLCAGGLIANAFVPDWNILYLLFKVIVEGRKSLDFLQGLLVYIAW